MTSSAIWVAQVPVQPLVQPIVQDAVQVLVQLPALNAASSPNFPSAEGFTPRMTDSSSDILSSSAESLSSAILTSWEVASCYSVFSNLQRTPIAVSQLANRRAACG
jgi:hypothetical protein